MLLFIVSVLIGVALIPVYAGGVWGLGLIWQIPLAILTGVLGMFVIFIATVGLISLTIDMNKTYERPDPFYLRVISFAFDYALWLTGARLRVEGLEKVPEGTFFLVSNHLSGFDPLILLVALRRLEMVFISKPENFKIPIIGRYMHRCRHLSIDRDDARKALTTINEAIELISDDIVSVGIFPEGTRSKTGELGEFKYGCFRIAQKSKGHPMVVCTIDNSQMITKHFFIIPTRVTVKVRAVIPYEDIAGKRTLELSDMVREIMLAKQEG